MTTINQPATSELAFAADKPLKKSMEFRIYEALRCSPMTVFELCKYFGKSDQSINPRCSEMKSRSIIKESGWRRCSEFGHLMDVLEVCAPYSRMPSGSHAKNKRSSVDIDKLKTALAFLQLMEEKEGFHLQRVTSLIEEVIAGV